MKKIRLPENLWSSTREASSITAQARRMARQGASGLPWRALAAAGLMGRLADPVGSNAEQMERALSGHRPEHVEILMEWAAKTITSELARAIEIQASVWADGLIREAEVIAALMPGDHDLPTDLAAWSHARDDGASLRWIFWAAGRSTEAIDAELRGLDESARPLLRGFFDAQLIKDDHLRAVAAAEPEAWWAAREDAPSPASADDSAFYDALEAELLEIGTGE